MSKKNLVVAVIQTTLEKNYKNLPSFALETIDGKTVAEYIYKKLRMVKKIDDVIFAIPDNDANKRLKSFLNEKGIKVYSGAEKDITQRVIDAGEICNATHIVRVICEYMLFSPVILEKMIEHHIKSKADFTYNENIRHAISLEISSARALKRLKKSCKINEFTRPSIMKSKPDIYKVEKFNIVSDEYGEYDKVNIACDSRSRFNIIKKILELPVKVESDRYNFLLKEMEEEERHIKNLKFRFGKGAIVLTDNCNLRCIMCGFNDIHDKHTLSKEKAIEALDFFIDEKVITIEITGGEPFTVKYIDEMIDHLIYRSKVEKRFPSVLITSNGLLINDERIERLKELKGVIIYISVDGIGSTHDSIRGKKGTYEKTLKTIERLHKKGIKIVISTVVQKKNLHQLFDIYKAFLHIKPVWHGFPLIEKTTEEAIKNHLEINDLSPLLDQAVMIVKDINKGKACAREPLYELFSYILRIKNEKFMAVSGEDCPIPLEFLSIRPNGTVLPCWHYNWDFPEGLNNINKLSLKDIISSEWYKREIYNAMKGSCAGCNTLCYAWSPNFKEKIKRNVDTNHDYIKFKEEFYNLVEDL